MSPEGNKVSGCCVMMVMMGDGEATFCVELVLCCVDDDDDDDDDASPSPFPPFPTGDG